VRVASGRRLVGLATLIALALIVLGVTGFQLSLPVLGGNAEQRAPLPGLKAVDASMLLKVGGGAPAGGELAFFAVEPSGNLVVSDSRRRTVMRFDSSGHLLSEWGPFLGDNVTIDEPAGVAVSGGDFYVLDRGTPRILRLDAGGRLLAVLSMESLGTYGLNGLAVDPVGNMYAADTGRNRILVFAPNGSLLRQFGRGGNDLGALMQPMMVSFAPDGSFFVADWENGRIERWAANFEATDAWLTGFRPFGVSVDQLGRVFVPDTERKRVEVYTAQGAPLGEIGAPGSPPVVVTPKQVAMAGSAALSLYVLGGDGIERVDLQNTPPPPQASSDVDLISLAVIGVLLALVVFAVLARRGRRHSLLGPTLGGPVRLDAEDGAQAEHEQARRNEDLLIAHQAKREQ
jgi:sugar lactone lactonase YvrE